MIIPCGPLIIRLPAALFLLTKIATTTEASMAWVMDIDFQTRSGSTRSPDCEMVSQTPFDDRTGISTNKVFNDLHELLVVVREIGRIDCQSLSVGCRMRFVEQSYTGTTFHFAVFVDLQRYDDELIGLAWSRHDSYNSFISMKYQASNFAQFLD